MTARLRLRALFASFVLAGVCALSTASFANPSLVIDVGSGEVLEHREAFRRWHPASLTKLMTAYVAFRAIEAGEASLNSGVRVSKRAAKQPPSKMYYAPGTVLRLDTALKIIMVKSANDIATAIAENIGKGEAPFVARMNAEAMRLGMSGTHFVNANGLHDDAQYTTARDLAILASQIRIEFPQYAPYFSLEAIAAGEKTYENFNPLIGRFAGADGMKTGFVCASGFNLIATATRAGRTLMAIELGAASQSERANRAAEHLAKGFSGSLAQPPVLIAQLAPYGEKQFEATNMREELCSPAAAAARELSENPDQRDENGKLVFASPFMGERTHVPVAVAVAPGGAVDEGWISPNYADVPTPTPRPDYNASAALAPVEADSAQKQ